MKTFLILTSLLLLLHIEAQEPLTLAEVAAGAESQMPGPQSFKWLSESGSYLHLAGQQIVKSTADNQNRDETWFDATDFNIRVVDFALSPDESKLLLITNRKFVFRRSFTAIYYLYDLESKALTKVAESKSISYATFSPDGRHIAYVNDRDLYIQHLFDNTILRVTDSGKNEGVMNGMANWSYDEEFYLTRCFYWSPDSKSLAFYAIDETQVTDLPTHSWPHEERLVRKYPLPGTSLPEVGIFIYHLDGDRVVQVRFNENNEKYIPKVQWTQTRGILSVMQLNRNQNRLDILHVNTETGEATRILSDISKAYHDVVRDSKLVYLKNGRQFLFTSDRDGYRHFYLHHISGRLEHQVTRGRWEVSEFIALDENRENPELYYTSTATSPLERPLYKVSLRGGHPLRLTSGSGIHKVRIGKTFNYFLDEYESVECPPKASLYALDNSREIKILIENSSLRGKQRGVPQSTRSFIKIPMQKNDSLNAYMVRPNDFDSTRKYPVLIYQYNGPGTQQVLDQWQPPHQLWHQFMAQEGYLIVVVDTRGTGGRGRDFQKSVHRRLGLLETDDLAGTARYLGSLSFVDKSRIGIWGWSYGGYTAALALLRFPGLFKAGIAVAPVTDWRYYHSLYSERYMQRPGSNKEGYKASALATYTGALEGYLLLIHGVADDNVLLYHSLLLSDQLVRAGKRFESYFFLNNSHNLSGVRLPFFRQMRSFISEKL